MRASVATCLRRSFQTKLALLFLATALAVSIAGGAFARDERPVRVRYGEHPGFIRIVFDWREPTSYVLEPQPDGVTVRFDAGNGFDLKRVKGKKRVSVISPDQGAATVTFARAQSFRHFLNGHHVVIDLLESKSGTPLPDAVAKTDAPVVQMTKSPKAQAAPKPAMELSAPTVAQQSATPTLLPAPEPALASAKAPPGDVESEAPAAAVNAAPPPEVKATSVAPDIDSIIPSELAGKAPPPKPLAANALALDVTKSGQSLVLDLATGPVPAAAFTRAKGHWILLDAPFVVSTEAAEAVGLDVVQFPLVDKTVLHMRTKTPGALSAERTDTGWRFLLSETTSTDVKQAPVRRAFEGKTGPRILVDDLQDARLLRVSDPEVGDALFVAVVLTPRRMTASHDTPDVRLLQTALGVVVAPKVEGVGARLRLGSLEIRRKGGLRLSEPQAIVDQQQTQITRIYPVEWRADSGSFNAGRRSRLAKLNGVQAIARNPIRLNLARYYLAKGYAAEAIGMVEFVAGSADAVTDNLDYMAMRGIGRAMLGQYDLSAKDLQSDTYNGDAQIELWRAMALSAAGEHRFAAAKFRQFWAAAAAWPLKQQVQLASAAGGSALAAGLPQLAKEFAHGLSSATNDAKDAAALTLVMAGVHAAKGEDNRALTAYKKAIKDGGLETQAKAELGLIRHQLARGQIEAEAAADRLAGLQMRWRGDRTEYETLKTLGELRLASSDYRQGFDALSEAARTFARRFDTTDVVAAMAAGFERAFVEGGADELPSLEAVALYRDFEDLAPPGHKGDLALAALARRLQALDLLDEADEILDHLVRRRLDGPLLAEIGGTLADLRLMRHKWANALSALDESERGEAEASPEVINRRIDLRARALAGTGKPKEALALLADASTADRLQLKADFAWRSGDWVAARSAYRALSDQGAFAEGKAGESDPDAQAVMALRWAVAAAMLGSEDELTMLGQRFEGKAQDPKLATALTMLTTLKKPRGEAIAAARAAISSVDAVSKTIGAYQAAQSKPPAQSG